MGYFFAIAVAALWILALHSGAPLLADYVGPAIIAAIGVHWIRSKAIEHKTAARWEAIRRQGLLQVVTSFRALNVKFLGDGSSAVLFFESEIDAELAASKAKGDYFQHTRGYVVLTRRLANDDLKVCESYLAKAVQAKGSDPEICPLTLQSVPESEEARTIREARKKALSAERQQIKIAMLLNIERRTKADFPETGATAVYVFASAMACKVGMSDDPDKRLRQVQTGHPASLRIVKSWWFATLDDAARVEKHVHSRLKVLGVHASGEWFKAPQAMVVENVRKSIADLIATTDIDRSLRALGARPSDGIESTLANLANLPWKKSQKGNEWLQFGEHHVVVFRRKGRYGFRYKDRFSEERFTTKADAKAAAFHQILKHINEQEGATARMEASDGCVHYT